jgi:hypothetical protein
MKFLPPLNTSGVGVSSGRYFAVGEDGMLTPPEDVTPAELSDIARNGFATVAPTAVPVDAPASKPATTANAKAAAGE